MMRVVHPAYHCLPNGGQGSFFPSGNLRLSCERVLATRSKSATGVVPPNDVGMRTLSGVCDCCFTVSGTRLALDSALNYIFRQRLRWRPL